MQAVSDPVSPFLSLFGCCALKINFTEGIEKSSCCAQDLLCLCSLFYNNSHKHSEQSSLNSHTTTHPSLVWFVPPLNIEGKQCKFPHGWSETWSIHFPHAGVCFSASVEPTNQSIQNSSGEEGKSSNGQFFVVEENLQLHQIRRDGSLSWKSCREEPAGTDT